MCDDDNPLILKLLFLESTARSLAAPLQGLQDVNLYKAVNQSQLVTLANPYNLDALLKA